MNFYKLNKLLKETGYDSQVVPGGQTVANQPMQSPQSMPIQQSSFQAQKQNVQDQQQQAQAKDVNYLLKKVSSKLGNNINKYNHLVNHLKNKPEMLDLFAQALDDVGGMQSSTFNRMN